MVAVDHVDLASREGEFLVLLGPSGCGKTTLLRMIAGLEEPTSGEIYIGGEKMNGLPPRIRKVAMVFQSYALYPHMTVARNIAFPLRAEGVDKAEQDKRVRWAAELLGIDRYLDRRPRQLSGGERQRVALARALAVDPKVLLLDEPFGALDANVRRDLRRWLREIHQELGITTIFVTHDQEEALDLADRVVILDQGRIAQMGTPREVCRNPNSAFVTRFLGDANRLEGVAARGAIRIGNTEVIRTAVADGPVEIYVRPGDLVWSAEGQGLPVTVTRVIDRASGRRVLASTESGFPLELDVDVDVDVEVGARGGVLVRRASAYPLRG